MLVKKGLSLLTGLLLAGLMVGISGCGFVSGGVGSTPGGKPDSVSILIDEPSPTQEKPVVTLAVVGMVQQLYAAIYALPEMPDNQACTTERGPHYTLTFDQGAKTLVTVIAMKDGCRPVSIAGESHDRQATTEFWRQLDAAIYAATPPTKVEWLAIQRLLSAGQAPQAARTTSAETTQRLYEAILALPLVPQGEVYADSTAAYQLVFHAANQAIPSVINQKQGLISLQGNFHSRGGVYAMNASFERLLGEILAGVTFAPARPDGASLTVQTQISASHSTMIADTLMQKLYAKVLTLHSTQAQANCPSGEDKVAGKGTFYDVSFMQWGLPILSVSVYEGSCRQIEITATSQFLQGDSEFWDIIHQATA